MAAFAMPLAAEMRAGARFSAAPLSWGLRPLAAQSPAPASAFGAAGRLAAAETGVSPLAGLAALFGLAGLASARRRGPRQGPSGASSSSPGLRANVVMLARPVYSSGPTPSWYRGKPKRGGNRKERTLRIGKYYTKYLPKQSDGLDAAHKKREWLMSHFAAWVRLKKEPGNGKPMTQAETKKRQLGLVTHEEMMSEVQDTLQIWPRVHPPPSSPPSREGSPKIEFERKSVAWENPDMTAQEGENLASFDGHPATFAQRVLSSL